MVQKAVFFDKDGTLIEDRPYSTDPGLIRLEKGALEALYKLQKAGYLIIVVTNQSGIARGFFEERDLLPVKRRLRELLLAGNVYLTDFYYCPHHPDGTVKNYAVNCLCRKPAPGMLHRAAGDHMIDLRDSWLVGDILNDIEAGNRAGCRTVLLDNDHETEWKMTALRRPYFIARHLCEAAAAIIAGLSPGVYVQ